MKKTREDFKFVPFISQELKRRTTKGKKTKYVEQALLRQFEWEDRNKKASFVEYNRLSSGIITKWDSDSGLLTLEQGNK